MQMRFMLTVFVLALTFSTPLARGADEADAEVRKAIDKGNEQYIKSMKAADAAGLASIYAEDGARFHDKGKMSRGQKAIQADVEGLFKKTGPITVTIETQELWVVDDRAYESGKWSYTFQLQGKEQTRLSGQYVTVWQKRKDGGWKIIADMAVPKEN
jgi:uncharacterized protein (TIGR02246 family)